MWTTKRDSEDILLSVRNLSVHFSQPSYWWKRVFNRELEPFKAVDDISFDMSRGKTLAVVGESGCGKTTTTRALLRLQTLTAGEIFFHHQPVHLLRGKALKHFRKRVQIIFQDPFSSMNPRMTVADILAEGMLAQGMKAAEILKKQIILLDQVNLPQNSLQRYPHQFSGGQRQRICIARALATEPELLICDEPTSALDMSVQAQILNLLKSLQQELAISYLFITHNLSVVSYLADDILIMKDGKIIERGSAQQILHHPQMEYTRHLLALS